MDKSKIPTFEFRKLTKEEWEEFVDALNKQGKPKHPLDGMNLQQKQMLDQALKAEFEKTYPKPEFSKSANSCQCAIPKPQSKNSENGINTYCANCGKDYSPKR